MRLECPACGDGIRRATLQLYEKAVHCFRCGFHQSRREYEATAPGEIQRVSGGSKPDDRSTFKSAFLPYTDFWVGVWHRMLWDSDGLRHDRLSWLLDRGISLNVIKRAQLGHNGERFVIPLPRGLEEDAGYPCGGLQERKKSAASNRLPSGTDSPISLSVPEGLVLSRYLGVKLRLDPVWSDPDDIKYLQFSDPNQVIYRPYPEGSPTIICEGEFDALRLASLRVDAVTATSGADSIHKVLNGMKFRSPLFIATDMDEAGDRAADRFLDKYPYAKRLTWESGDITEALADAESPAHRLEKFIRNAKRQ